MVFEEFTKKLGVIQANEYLSIDRTMEIKWEIVGSKRLWKCSSQELDEILMAYRKEYRCINS